MTRLQRRKTRKQQLRINFKIKKSLSKDKLIHICCYCKQVFLIENLTVEHIVPISWGGSNEPSNVTLACAPCNQQRGRESWLIKKSLMQCKYNDKINVFLPALNLPIN